MDTLKEIISLFMSRYMFYPYFVFAIFGTCLSIRKEKLSARKKTVFFMLSLSVSGCLSFILSYRNIVMRSIPSIAIYSSLAAIFLFVFGLLSYKLFTKAYDFSLKLINKYKISDFLYINRAGVAVFIYSVLCFLIQTENIDDWSLTFYSLNYSMGFSSRFLIGSIVSLISAGHPNKLIVYAVCFLSFLFITISISCFINSIFKNADNSEKPALLFLSAIYLLSPGSFIADCGGGNFGRLDMFAFLFASIGIIIFAKIKNTYLKYLSLLIFCIIGNLAYQGFIFMYFALVFIVMVFDIYNSDKKEKRKRIILCTLVCTVTALSFLAIQLLQSIKFDNVEEMYNYLTSISELPIVKEPLRFEYFASFKTLFYGNMVFSFENEYLLRERLFLLIVFSLPFIAVFIEIFTSLFKSEKSNNIKIYSSPIFWSLLSMLFALPQFIINVDWGRWVSSETTVLFFAVLYPYYAGSKEMTHSLSLLSKRIVSHKFIFAALAIYISVFSIMVTTKINGDFKFPLEFFKKISEFITSF